MRLVLKLDRFVVSPAEQRTRIAAIRAGFFPQPPADLAVTALPAPPAEPEPVEPELPEPVELVLSTDAERFVWMSQEYRAWQATYPKVLSPFPAIINIGAKAFGTTPESLIGPQRHWPLARHRMKVMAFAQFVTSAGWCALGRAFHRDHTTVLHAHKRFGGLVESVLLIEEGQP